MKPLTRRWRKLALEGLCVTFACSIPVAASAIQPDGPFAKYRERHVEEWANQDRDIDARLAALENRFGKKPNIIYILTDDIGWVGKVAASTVGLRRPSSTAWPSKVCDFGRLMLSHLALPPASRL